MSVAVRSSSMAPMSGTPTTPSATSRMGAESARICRCCAWMTASLRSSSAASADFSSASRRAAAAMASSSRAELWSASCARWRSVDG
ncbi:hypothetical protein WME95_10850 [Sorangium sp. So ce327]|uniref:hypothetical protein n=1 Tax=Sorangium sp. So ce327 TaxID=3133301 RepID=UPI003F63D2A3